jgi:putative phosphoesterase
MIGVISDTHGLLRPEALTALQGSELILHAGDIGPSEILDRLRDIAPLHVVRGNCDHGPWARALPETDVVTVGGRDIYMIHDIGELDLTPAVAGFIAVIYGHSHQPKVEERDGVLYLNPGSAGPKRFSLPVSVAHLHLGAGRVSAEIIELEV